MSHYVTLCVSELRLVGSLIFDWLSMLCQQTTATYTIMSRAPKLKDVDAPILYVAIDCSAGDFE